MSEKRAGHNTEACRAEHLEEIQAKHVVEELTSEVREADKQVYELRNKKILGSLNLRHRTINVAIDIQCCVFEHEVDLRYCEFKQAVNFSRCTFRHRFNSGDEVEARTVYRKDLICKKAVFEGAVGFNGTRIEGSAYFSETFFKNKQEQVDFAWASVGQTLECQKATFKGPVSFYSLRCEGNGYFPGALFEGTTDFNFLECSNLSCDNATFQGDATFNPLNCRDTGFFKDAEFQSKVDFRYASLGGNLQCEDAAFKGPAIFSSLKCGGDGYFNRVKFEGEVDFSDASFCMDLICNSAVFEGKTNFNFLRCSTFYCRRATFNGTASFNSLECGRWAYLNGSAFQNEKQAADFAYASLGANLECGEYEGTDDGTILKGTVFTGPVRFLSLKCDNFQAAGAHFAKAADLSFARVSGRLDLVGTKFEGDVLLHGTTIGTLVLDDTFPFARKSSLELRECTFERFEGTEKRGKQFAKEQNPTKFSRDPYLQLDRYYQSVGNDAAAKKIYYLGRVALRENAKGKHTSTKWALTTRWGDWWLKWLTGYGVRTWQLLFPIVFFLIAGTAVFWSDEALKAKLPPPSEAYVEASTPSTPPTEEQGSNDWTHKLYNRGVYSLDLFLPLVNLHVADRWEPQGLWRGVYAHFLHPMIGFLLIPLLAASLTGIVRRR